MDKWFYLNNIRLWIKGAIYEGGSILQLNDKSLEYMSNLTSYSKQYGDDIHDLTYLHRHFFLISVAKTREWLIELSKVDNELKNILETLDGKFPDIRDLRNMYEHDISYYKEKGHKQEQFIKTEKNFFAVDATSVIFNNEGYLIGGRLNIQLVIDYLTQIYPVIETKLIEVVE